MFNETAHSFFVWGSVTAKWVVFYFFFKSLAYWPFRTRLLACLIRAAILYFSCRLHLFTSQCFVIGSPD